MLEQWRLIYWDEVVHPVLRTTDLSSPLAVVELTEPRRTITRSAPLVEELSRGRVAVDLGDGKRLTLALGQWRLYR